MEAVTPRPISLELALARAMEHVASAQSEEGSWKGDYGGPMFLLPMYVGTTWVAGIPVEEAVRADIERYFRNAQNDDGSFGLHVEGPGMVFTTVLSYVALRLLGVRPDDEATRRAREWFLARGGPLASASWGKFFLAVLGLYSYDGLAPVPPELWLLPESLPVHPWRMWCHSRMVYLPMSWLYGARATAPVTPLVETLRQELYDRPWEQIAWADHRWTVAADDDYRPTDPLYKRINVPLLAYERLPVRPLRKRSMAFVLDQVGREDRNTDYICIGPVNKLYHTLVWHFADPGGEAFRRHVARLPDYLWAARDGTKMQGYNSSQLWDTAFMVQALVAAGADKAHLDALRKAFGYVERNQVLEDVPDRERCFRDPSKGGWPFSNRAHGWPITDCTAEGLKASLALEPFVDDPIGEDRLTDAIDLVLWWQNEDGGWASYERTRGPKWLERLNPSNCFGEIMIDWSYVECTSACLQAMAAYKARFPGRRDHGIEAATERGRRFLLEQQRPDGSWYGSWGVCFTYGTWFATHALRATGLSADHPALRRAADFLRSKQLPDGGWGELAESNLAMRYVSTDTGQAVMTSWALLALSACGEADRPEVAAGVRFLLDRQQPDGSWPDEHISGMFNKTCAITYDNYTKIFPLWALATLRGA